MKKDTIFRVTNGVGFVANAVSMCFPYDHPTRLSYKLLSGISNFASMVMLMGSGLQDMITGEKKSGLSVALVTTFFANEASVISMNNISHMAEHPEDMALDSHYLVRDGAVASAQLMNVLCGMYPQKEVTLPDIFSRKSDKLTP